MTVAIAGGVLGFWVLMIWLRKMERGRVHRTIWGPLIVSVRRLEAAFGEAFLPVVQRTVDAISEWARTVGPATKEDE